jgi:hypothetical protein
VTRSRRSARSGRVPVADLVPIVGDGSVAGPVAEGVTVPVLIFDAAARPDVAEAVRIQRYLPPGDVTVRWAVERRDRDRVLLLLDFDRPLATRAVFRFSIETQGILVEAALTARLVYLQPGAPGDRLRDVPDAPRLLVELPDTGFRQTWDVLFLERTTEVLRRRGGLSRARARREAAAVIATLRQVTRFRMPGR